MEKMGRKVIVALAAVLFVFTAMAGVEAWELMTINPTHLELVPGGPAQKCDITVSGFLESGESRVINAWVVNAINGGAMTDLELQLKHPSEGSASGIEDGLVTLNWVDDADPDFLELWVSAKSGATVGAHYNLVIWNVGGGQLVGFSAGTVDATNIPEFATIAIPVAAILGLMFFFNHRKRRKE